MSDVYSKILLTITIEIVDERFPPSAAEIAQTSTMSDTIQASTSIYRGNAKYLAVKFELHDSNQGISSVPVSVAEDLIQHCQTQNSNEPEWDLLIKRRSEKTLSSKTGPITHYRDAQNPDLVLLAARFSLDGNEMTLVKKDDRTIVPIARLNKSRKYEIRDQCTYAISEYVFWNPLQDRRRNGVKAEILRYTKSSTQTFAPVPSPTLAPTQDPTSNTESILPHRHRSDRFDVTTADSEAHFRWQEGDGLTQVPFKIMEALQQYRSNHGQWPACVRRNPVELGKDGVPARYCSQDFRTTYTASKFACGKYVLILLQDHGEPNSTHLLGKSRSGYRPAQGSFVPHDLSPNGTRYYLWDPVTGQDQVEDEEAVYVAKFPVKTPNGGCSEPARTAANADTDVDDGTDHNHRPSKRRRTGEVPTLQGANGLSLSGRNSAMTSEQDSRVQTPRPDTTSGALRQGKYSSRGQTNTHPRSSTSAERTRSTPGSETSMTRLERHTTPGPTTTREGTGQVMTQSVENGLQASPTHVVIGGSVPGSINIPKPPTISEPIHTLRHSLQAAFTPASFSGDNVTIPTASSRIGHDHYFVFQSTILEASMRRVRVSQCKTVSHLFQHARFAKLGQSLRGLILHQEGLEPIGIVRDDEDGYQNAIEHILAHDDKEIVVVRDEE